MMGNVCDVKSIVSNVIAGRGRGALATPPLLHLFLSLFGKIVNATKEDLIIIIIIMSPPPPPATSSLYPFRNNHLTKTMHQLQGESFSNIL